MDSAKLDDVDLGSISDLAPETEPSSNGSSQSDPDSPGHLDHDRPEPRVLLRGQFVQVLDRRDYPRRYSNIVEFRTRDALGMDWCVAGSLWTSEWEELYELIEDRVLQSVCDNPRNYGFHAFEH